MVEEIGSVVQEVGFEAAVSAVLFYLVFSLQNRIFTVIENNTKAVAELKTTIERCQFMHSNGGVSNQSDKVTP
jgi:hypothetical protein